MERVRKKARETQSSKLFRFISENQGLSAQEISGRLGWTQSKTNRMLTTLEKKGWIVKRVYSAAQPAIVTKPEAVNQHVDVRFVKLAAWKAKLEEREKELFDKCVTMQMQGDKTAATMYANQCAEIKKIIKLVDSTEEVLSKLSILEE